MKGLSPGGVQNSTTMKLSLGMMAKMKTQAAAVKKKVLLNKEQERFVRDVTGTKEYKQSIDDYQKSLMEVIVPLAPEGVGKQPSYEIGRILTESLEQAVRSAYSKAQDKLEEHPKLECRNRVLEERLADSVHSHLQEISSLRMRAKSGQPGDASMKLQHSRTAPPTTDEDMSFYEPLKFLDEAQRKLVMVVARHKVEEALDGDEKAKFLSMIAKGGEEDESAKQELVKLRESNARLESDLESLRRELEEERKESVQKIRQLEQLLNKLRRASEKAGGDKLEDLEVEAPEPEIPPPPQMQRRDSKEMSMQTDKENMEVQTMSTPVRKETKESGTQTDKVQEAPKPAAIDPDAETRKKLKRVSVQLEDAEREAEQQKAAIAQAKQELLAERASAEQKAEALVKAAQEAETILRRDLEKSTAKTVEVEQENIELKAVVEELKLRLQKLATVAKKHGGETFEAVQGMLKEAGLDDVIAAVNKEKVHKRLYNDFFERVRRLEDLRMKLQQYRAQEYVARMQAHMQFGTMVMVSNPNNEISKLKVLPIQTGETKVLPIQTVQLINPTQPAEVMPKDPAVAPALTNAGMVQHGLKSSDHIVHVVEPMMMSFVPPMPPASSVSFVGPPLPPPSSVVGQNSKGKVQPYPVVQPIPRAAVPHPQNKPQQSEAHETHDTRFVVQGAVVHLSSAAMAGEPARNPNVVPVPGGAGWVLARQDPPLAQNSPGGEGQIEVSCTGLLMAPVASVHQVEKGKGKHGLRAERGHDTGLRKLLEQASQPVSEDQKPLESLPKDERAVESLPKAASTFPKGFFSSTPSSMDPQPKESFSGLLTGQAAPVTRPNVRRKLLGAPHIAGQEERKINVSKSAPTLEQLSKASPANPPATVVLPPVTASYAVQGRAEPIHSHGVPSAQASGKWRQNA